MHAEYSDGLSLYALAKKYDRSPAAIREVFRRRGLSVRKYVKPAGVKIDPRTGRRLAKKPTSGKRIAELIEQCRRVAVPTELKCEWRHWPLTRRGEFIARLRESLKRRGLLRTPRPEQPFSKNVEPFDYASPRAQALMKQINQGTNSQTKRAQLRPNCEGLIYGERFWFWVPYMEPFGHGGSYQVGTYKPGIGRPMLHHVIWEAANGRPVPPLHTIRFADGNPNNFDPKNLILQHRDEVAAETMSKVHRRRTRELTARLLKVHQEKQYGRNKRTHDFLTQRRKVHSPRAVESQFA